MVMFPHSTWSAKILILIRLWEIYIVNLRSTTKLHKESKKQNILKWNSKESSRKWNQDGQEEMQEGKTEDIAGWPEWRHVSTLPS